MKFKKDAPDPDDSLCSLNSRNVFSEGMSLPVGCAFEQIDIFYSDKYSVHTYNRKRFLSNYWKEIFRLKDNDDICYWNGEENEIY
jgi:hypothetical protein